LKIFIKKLYENLRLKQKVIPFNSASLQDHRLLKYRRVVRNSGRGGSRITIYRHVLASVIVLIIIRGYLLGFIAVCSSF